MKPPGNDNTGGQFKGMQSISDSSTAGLLTKVQSTERLAGSIERVNYHNESVASECCVFNTGFTAGTTFPPHIAMLRTVTSGKAFRGAS
jgi:hypothetical protein